MEEGDGVRLLLEHLSQVKLQAEEREFALKTRIKDLEGTVGALKGRVEFYEDEVRRGCPTKASCPSTPFPLIPKPVDKLSQSKLVSVDVPTLTMSCKSPPFEHRPVRASSDYLYSWSCPAVVSRSSRSSSPRNIASRHWTTGRHSQTSSIRTGHALKGRSTA
jgi:hypothetical protein